MPLLFLLMRTVEAFDQGLERLQNRFFAPPNFPAADNSAPNLEAAQENENNKVDEENRNGVDHEPELKVRSL
ncbi:hypothetical protein B1F79_04480 [Coxiella-like endosymbiont of Rhipicephalus sanguineus]|uniref:hypothetical protein n=1 Tax=Coxiella-like endosymbiont of Rhipicephalus sanguineus TaxID=1955402 RepID=UPI00203EC225|nr:hypothetical protein [Coxiella-like endosymbiont of Rhipicephalus sanguineus]MBT8506718.1 hypothetical protein [Coxiella-like endosymbiont of Rhipicephalus sanguineus]